MRILNLSKVGLRAALIVSLTLTTSLGTAGPAQAQQKQKSNVQRERCAQVAARAVNTPGSLYYQAPVSGGGGGGGIAGAIIGAVIVTAIAASIAQAARNKAENNCLVAAGLKPNTEPSEASDKPTRSGAGQSRAASKKHDPDAGNEAVGTGPHRGGGVHAWVAESLKSQK